ncbi:hypothetical protein STCU_10114 [Strigomonas culicis]|uniref:Uncharacterized protein n=1 Tax=Strigomonas culicis TaxID=28005 RepID=S9V5P3_9TRYP|nr:hypothetical protein STCU_10114 [Strigomonas culicis]|eukprot:EPY18210.1 hypothetical protein STCU_10114 [Strigomonas culicis]
MQNSHNNNNHTHTRLRDELEDSDDGIFLLPPNLQHAAKTHEQMMMPHSGATPLHPGGAAVYAKPINYFSAAAALPPTPTTPNHEDGRRSTSTVSASASSVSSSSSRSLSATPPAPHYHAKREGRKEKQRHQQQHQEQEQQEEAAEPQQQHGNNDNNNSNNNPNNMLFDAMDAELLQLIKDYYERKRQQQQTQQNQHPKSAHTHTTGYTASPIESSTTSIPNHSTHSNNNTNTNTNNTHNNIFAVLSHRQSPALTAAAAPVVRERPPLTGDTHRMPRTPPAGPQRVVARAPAAARRRGPVLAAGPTWRASLNLLPPPAVLQLDLLRARLRQRHIVEPRAGDDCQRPRSSAEHRHCPLSAASRVGYARPPRCFFHRQLPRLQQLLHGVLLPRALLELLSQNCVAGQEVLHHWEPVEGGHSGLHHTLLPFTTSSRSSASTGGRATSFATWAASMRFQISSP